MGMIVSKDIYQSAHPFQRRVTLRVERLRMECFIVTMSPPSVVSLPWKSKYPISGVEQQPDTSETDLTRRYFVGEHMCT